MFAISFDMTVSSLEEHYGMPYNRAYYEMLISFSADNRQILLSYSTRTH